MTASQFSTLICYMIICSFIPGPGNILSLNTTSRYGWKKSRFLILGVCCGYGIVQAICTVAIATVGSVLSSVLSVLKYAGGIYMIYLAIQIIRSSPHETGTAEYPSFKKGLLLQLVNVKIYFYITSLLTAYFIPYSKNAFSLALWGIFAVSIGSLASLTLAFAGVKIQKIYLKYFKSINIVLGLFLIYCAFNIVKH